MMTNSSLKPRLLPHEALLASPPTKTGALLSLIAKTESQYITADWLLKLSRITHQIIFIKNDRTTQTKIIKTLAPDKSKERIIRALKKKHPNNKFLFPVCQQPEPESGSGSGSGLIIKKDHFGPLF